MIDTMHRVGTAVLVAAAALLTAGCDPRNETLTLAPWHGAAAGIADSAAAGALGADESAEDAELTAKVRTAIAADSELQPQQIGVTTDDGAVTLSGTVDSQSLRDRAVQLAGSVDGVAEVQDRLEVRD